MQTRNGFLLPLLMMMAVACSDSGPPEPDKHAARLREQAAAERRKVASQHLVESSTVSSFVSATSMATALDIPADRVVSAQLTSPHDDAALVAPTYGVITPRRGSSLAVMSTGLPAYHSRPQASPTW